MSLVIGTAAFLLFLLYDVNKIRWHKPILNALYPAGVLLLTVSAALGISASLSAGFVPGISTIIFLALAILSAAATVYALFFALPFRKTYSGSGRVGVVSTGLYGMCRHPACWPFALVYVFLYLAFPGRALLCAMLLFPVLNLLYVTLQDRYIFPRSIEGYEAYRRRVPFLIPRRRR